MANHCSKSHQPEETTFQWTKNPTPLSQITPAFILPEHLRPQLSSVSALAAIPIIDLTEEEGRLVEKVAAACEEYGFFHVINHGVPEELCVGILGAVKEVFESSPRVKDELYSDDPRKEARLYGRHLRVDGSEEGKVLMWSEAFIHPWHPTTKDFTDLLPCDPPKYRALIAEYAMETSKLVTRLLSLLSLGLGLDKDHLSRKHGPSPRRRAQANYYPPCPNPELVVGLATHSDFDTLTLLQQWGQVPGLQVIKDTKWVSVDPIPNSFIVNVGDQLQVLSNGKYKSVHHRAVANEHELRVSMAVFIGPDEEAVVGPVEELINEENPRVYRSYVYKEFLQEVYRQDGTRRRVKEVFKVKQ